MQLLRYTHLMRTIQTQYSDHVLTVTLSRPEAMNALTLELLDGLRIIIQELYQDSDIRGIIITGEGEKSFAAGADIKEFVTLTPDEAFSLSRKGQELFKLIEDCPKPVIAAVNGYALGGGCEMADGDYAIDGGFVCVSADTGDESGAGGVFFDWVGGSYLRAGDGLALGRGFWRRDSAASDPAL